MDSGQCVTCGIIRIEDFRDGKELFFCILVKMCDRKGTEFLWCISIIINRRMEISLSYVLHIIGKLTVQMCQYIFGKIMRRHGRVHTCKITDLFGNDRADTCHAGIDCFGYRHRFCKDCRNEFFLRSRHRILFRHRIRNKVIASRQYFTYRTHLCRDVLDTVDDASVQITENNVAVFSHDLDDQFFPAQVTHLIQMLNIQVDDTLE